VETENTSNKKGIIIVVALFIMFSMTIISALHPTQCNDGIDNDNDGLTDYPQDDGCESSRGGTESPQCNDGIDNDLDGKIDYLQDDGCDNQYDSTEARKLGYASACLDRGEKLWNIFGDNTTSGCLGTLGTSCTMCVLMTETGNYSANPSRCYGLPQCGFGNGNSGGVGGNTTLNVTPPNLTINNPIQDNVYDSRSVLLDLNVDEKSDIYYLDLINGRGRWTRVCTNCYSYSRERSFNEGNNSLMFRATDVVGTPAYFNLSFVMDSKDPKISRTNPTRGFANGEFFVEFDEANPESVFLNYGNSTELRNKEVNISDCNLNKKKYSCNVNVDLANYDGQEIDYWFNITDVASSTDESRHYTLSVDDSAPVINNPNSFFDIDGRYVYFSINVTEENLDEVGYSYMDSRGRQKEKKLCSSLRNGLCEKRVSFKDGNHNLTVYVNDEAGNDDKINISFFIDSKKPRISRTNPTRGFADGNFEVQFKEEYPESVFLNYGNSAELRNKEINISDCSLNKKKYSCNIDVNLDDYNGQKIKYWFNVTDTVGNIDESRQYSLDVDTVAPIINNPNSFWRQGEGRYSKYIYFSINITEDNLDEVSYSYIDYRDREKEKKLCSRLRNGICEKRVLFRDGDYDLTVQINDEAGNNIVVPADFNVDN